MLSPAVSTLPYACDGRLTLSAEAGFVSYAWSNGTNGAAATVSTSGSYTVTVSNGSGCTGTASVLATVPALPTASIQGPGSVCAGGSVSLSGPAGFTGYAWSSGQSTASVSVSPGASGTYTLTVSDGNGCTATATTLVAVLAPPGVSIGGNAVLCNGSTSTLTATMGLSSYVWSTNENGPSIAVNAAGIYSVTATDANGCTNTANRTVFRSDIIVLTAATTSAGCQIGGAIVVEGISGGATPYLVAIGNTRRQNDGLTDVVFENLPKGTYLLAVTDANGCTTNQSLAIEQRCTSEIYAPNAIAPERGDNAYFMLFGAGDFNIDRLQIFDRWGNKMSELLDIPGNNPTAGWDGRFNNEWVLPGVYVYWAKITWPDGQTTQISGEVTVVR